MLSCKVSQPINSALNIKLFRNLCQTNKDRSGSVDLNRYTPIDKCHGAGLKRCRVVHGGGRRLATNDRRGGQLGAHRRFHLNGHYISQDYPEHLRRIRFKDPQTQQTMVFLTNNTSLPPLTIAALYKSRWQVELWACPRFCVNGLIAGNCLHLQRKRNDRKQRTDRPPAGGLQKA